MTEDFWDFWYPWSPAKFKSDTMDLDPYQDGVYRRLIDHYMETRQGLPNSDAALARIAGIGLNEFLENCPDVKKFFVLNSETGRLENKRCEIILRDQDEISENRSDRAKKGADARWKKDKQKQGELSLKDASSNAKPMLVHATEQNTTKQTPHSPPKGGGVDPYRDGEDLARAESLIGRGVEEILSDVQYDQAKKNSPGWDMEYLWLKFKGGIADGSRTPPRDPAAAFPGWCLSYTKGKRPS